MPYNASADLWYQYYKDGGPQNTNLIWLFGVRVLFSILALLLNASVIYITIKEKSLHGTCNILIAMECVFAIFLDLNYFASFGLIISGIPFIPYGQCFPFVATMSILANLGHFTMLLTGLDRLFAVLFPIWYKTRNERSYMFLLCLPLSCYAIFLFVIFILDFDGEIMVNCTINDIQLGKNGPLMSSYAIVLSVVIVFIYILMWCTIFLFKQTTKNMNEINKRLAKSLIIIFGINLFGVIFRNCATLVMSLNNMDTYMRRFVGIWLTFVTIIVYAMNAPVLYLMSKEYRRKFDRHFPFLQCLFSIRISYNVGTDQNGQAPGKIVNHNQIGNQIVQENLPQRIMTDVQTE